MDRVTPSFPQQIGGPHKPSQERGAEAGDDACIRLVVFTSHHRREVQRQADDACIRLVVLTSHHRREVQSQAANTKTFPSPHSSLFLLAATNTRCFAGMAKEEHRPRLEN